MSKLTADTLMPLFSALPEQEQHAFAEKITKLLGKSEKRRTPSVTRQSQRDKILHKAADQLGEHFRPGNQDLLVYKIMNDDW